MAAVMIIFVSLVTIAYSLFFIGLILLPRQWHVLPKVSNRAGAMISVIVPFRNEALNLPAILDDLVAQDYYRENLEIILVNDHSTDDSFSIIEKRTKQFSNLKLVSLPIESTGKKAAIGYAVSLAKGDLIFTTDADCRLPQKWISSTVSYYKQTGARLILGPVRYNQGKSIFSRMLALEFTSLVSTAAAMALLKKPILCNGANMAFEKSVFPESIDIMEPTTPSGDDIFLLLHVKKIFPDKIRFHLSEDALIETKPPGNIHEFLEQRVRWFSKSSFYSDHEIILTGIIVAFMNAGLIISLLTGLLFPKFLFIPLAVILLKCIIDFLFLIPYLAFFRQNSLCVLIPLVGVLYPFYLFFVAAKSLKGKFIWKGRSYFIR